MNTKTENLDDLIEEAAETETEATAEAENLDDLIEEAAEAEAEAEAETEDEAETEAEGKPKAEKTPAEPAKLARGRMPAALVAHIRFNEDGNDSEIARKFFTTPGKINDIKKGRGFAYITKDTKFSKADIDAAITKVKENFVSGKGRGGKVSDTTIDDAKYAIECLEKMVASDESTLEADRAATRKPRGKDKDEAQVEEASDDVKETSDAAAEEPVVEEVTDDDLAGLLDD